MNSRSFASVVQLILVFVMLASIVMIGQQFEMGIYKVGLLILIASALLQVIFGNIPPAANLAKSLRMFLTFGIVVVVIFVLSLLLVPLLVQLGK
ncbi:MAG: hypothetical protein U0175_16165 [Caldilineaceae bacterium]